MLGHYRVLDLCDGISQFGSYLLASLGAEVICVEPPDGVATRRDGPFVDDVVDAERSLTHWAYNQGKASVTADLTTPEGRATLLSLVAGADALIEDRKAGELAALGLAHDDLLAANPALVHASITPYGSTGPRAGWAGSDLTATAASGFLQISGDDDRAPVRVSAVPQAFLQAAGDAAVATLIALREARRSRAGQHIDVSVMESLTHALVQDVGPRIGASPISRLAGGLQLGPLRVPLLFPCKDGYTIAVTLTGAAFAPFSERLLAWEAEEGFADDDLLGIDWENFGNQLIAGEVPVELLNKVFANQAAFLATKTKAELFEAAFSRNVLLTPSATIDDLLANEHFIERAFWADTELDDGRVARFCGPLVRFSADQPSRSSAVPSLGEHNNAVTAQRTPVVLRGGDSGADDNPHLLGPVATDDPTLGTNPALAAGTDYTLPLAGLKVVDFSWVIVTPSSTRILCDYGATVVKVETEGRPDTMRTVNPFVNDEAHPDNAAGYGVYNAGKRSLSLNLAKPEAREVVTDLVRWADVVTESWSPGTLDRMGFGYDVMREINPDVVLVSSSLLGQSGPHATLAGYGFMAAALAGFYELTGWPDRSPAGPYGPYTDYLAPRVLVSSVMAALERRDLTGEGCHIDLSQTEAALHYLAPAILDVALNERNVTRCGNDDPHMSPHGVFPCAGDDAWVAIACTDAAWPALVGCIGADDLAGLDQAARRERAEHIADAIAAWTKARSGDEAAQALQAVGVDAYAALNAQGACDDPQFEHRQHQVEVPQSHAGTMWTHACRTRMSRTPAVLRRGGPCLGEDNWEVLTDFLGYSADRVADLAASETLG